MSSPYHEQLHLLPHIVNHLQMPKRILARLRSEGHTLPKQYSTVLLSTRYAARAHAASSADASRQPHYDQLLSQQRKQRYVWRMKRLSPQANAWTWFSTLSDWVRLTLDLPLHKSSVRLQRMVLTSIRFDYSPYSTFASNNLDWVGFFQADTDLTRRNIEKADALLEEGGDWDRSVRRLDIASSLDRVVCLLIPQLLIPSCFKRSA